MSAPNRIYIHTDAHNDTYYELSDCCDDEVDYIRADIHEAEIDATQTALSLMNKTAEIMSKEIDALKAELAALKAAPVVLSADEVTRRGTYKWRLSKTSPWSYTKVIKRYNGDFFMLRLGKRDEEILYGEFSGPIKIPEV